MSGRTESCYQSIPKTVTLWKTRERKPIVKPVTLKRSDGSEFTISRREFKKLRKAGKIRGGLEK